MEGRTIVRPDLRMLRQPSMCRRPFNGGPDNRPARPVYRCLNRKIRHGLQWRAGQSSGQTRRFVLDLTTSQPPSMEGRTIVRPDWPVRKRKREWRSSFNGGPDNRPARRAEIARNVGRYSRLQWRAGQSSGQTPGSKQRRSRATSLQWRAGQSSGQTSDSGD